MHLIKCFVCIWKHTGSQASHEATWRLLLWAVWKWFRFLHLCLPSRMGWWWWFNTYVPGTLKCVRMGLADLNMAEGKGRENGLSLQWDIFFLSNLRLNPKYVHAMNNLGNILKERNDLLEAEELLLLAVQIQYVLNTTIHLLLHGCNVVLSESFLVCFQAWVGHRRSFGRQRTGETRWQNSLLVLLNPWTVINRITKGFLLV